MRSAGATGKEGRVVVQPVRAVSPAQQRCIVRGDIPASGDYLVGHEVTSHRGYTSRHSDRYLVGSVRHPFSSVEHRCCTLHAGANLLPRVTPVARQRVFPARVESKSKPASALTAETSRVEPQIELKRSDGTQPHCLGDDHLGRFKPTRVEPSHSLFSIARAEGWNTP